jgi:hypothetical protein
MTPDTQWYFARGGQQQGPVSLDALRQMLASSQISSADLVWSEGMADWQPAGQVQALRLPPAAPMVAAVPPPVQPVGQAGYGVQPVTVPYATRPTPFYPSGQSYNGLAVAGFVCAFLMPLVGLILSLVALSCMKSSGNFEGRGLAKAGAIIGGVIIGSLFLFGCLWFIVVAAAIGAGAGR